MISDWDDKKGRAIGKGYGFLNSLLDKKEQNVKDFIRQRQCNGYNPKLTDIRDFWYGKNNVTDDLFVYIKIYLEDKKVNKNKKERKIKPATLVHYKTLEKKLKLFKKNISLSEIDESFMLRFLSFLQKTESGDYNNIKFFKAILTKALKDELIIDKTWKNVTVEKPKEKNDFLDTENLTKFVNCNLDHRPALKRTRDKFLFSVYTSLRYGDVSELKISDVKDYVLTITQQKTENPVTIPLLEEAKQIYNIYAEGKNPNDYLFKKVTNQSDNRNLKEIAKVAEIDKHLSFHLSRHTFASTLINAGVDSFIVSKMMGHARPIQTFNYTNTTVNYMKQHLGNAKFL